MPAANAVVYIWTTSMNQTWAAFLLLIAVTAQLFCGTASLTSASRMLFAFARDGAVPASRIWCRLTPNRVPANAVIAVAALAWALMLPTLANGAIGYLVGTSIAVIGLYISYAMPIILRLRAGQRFKRGAWSLGSALPVDRHAGGGLDSARSACCSCCPCPRTAFPVRPSSTGMS